MEQLDVTDWAVLDQLQHDASLSNVALAERLHLSAPTCLRRVKRLQALGLIERTVAHLHPQRVAALAGHGLQAIVEVTLDHQGAEHLLAFEQRACADAAVQQCWRVSSGPDFVLVLHCTDMPHYHATAQQLLTHNANVRNVKTFFATHRAKFGHLIPGLASHAGTTPPKSTLS